MRVLKVILLVCCVIAAGLTALGLLIGIWLPDVVFAPKSTLAYAKLSSGYTFHVIQYWNRGDFYSTELHVIAPDGRKQEHTLDGDDNKSWSVPMRVDESNRVVSVTLGGRRERKVSY